MKPIYAFPQFDVFMTFVVERHRIWQRRRDGKPAPWTTDLILQQYRFCNVYRELDRTTRWIAKHWRAPHKNYEHLWFSMVVARFVNHPDTLRELALPGRWNHAQFVRVLSARKDSGQKVFGSAYIISTNGQPMDKALYLAEHVLDPLWSRREKLKPKAKDSLVAYHNRLLDEQGLGSFMAAQVVADIKYVTPLLHAKDFWTFAASGPGSRRGMSYVLDLDPATKWREHEWRSALAELQVLVDPVIEHRKMPRIHGQDLQNCLCEFSKWMRTKHGTGRPKQKFTPFVEA